MSDITITIPGGTKKRLLTAGKRHTRNIVVEAEGGDYDKGYESGVADGKKAEYDAFWDMFQENGNRTDYRYAFAYTQWTEEMFKLKYPIKIVGEGACAFYEFPVVWADKVFEVDLSEGTNLIWIFRFSKLTHIGKCDLSSATSIEGGFAFCHNLVSIEEIVSNENLAWTNIFNYSAALAEIRFSGVIGKSINLPECSKLSMESVDSIINALKNLAGQTAQTLTFHATVGGKLTEAQKAAITAKNWTLVY